MKIKMDKSLMIFLIAIVALFFFMSSRSKAVGDKCGKKDGKVVRCKNSVCDKNPSTLKDLSGECVKSGTGWRKEKKDKKKSS